MWDHLVLCSDTAMDKTKQEWQRRIQSTCPFQEGIAATYCWQSWPRLPKPGWLRRLHSVLFCFVFFFFKLPPSTQHPKDRRSPINPMTQVRIKVANSPKESGGSRVCHLAAFYCFLCVKIPSMCPHQWGPPLPLLHGLLQMLSLQDKERKHSGPREGTASPGCSSSQLGPRTSPLTGLTHVRWIFICQVAIMTRKHSL